MTYSLLKGFEKYGMLLGMAVIDDAKLVFVLDSGSTHNIIASFVYEKFKEHFTTQDSKMSLIGIEGNRVVNPTVSTEITIGSCSTITEFSVADMDKTVMQVMKETGIQIHGLLGVPFLRDNNCIIDFGKMEIEIAGPKQ